MSNKDLDQELRYEKKSAWSENHDDIMQFGEQYKQYLKSAKTEREFVQASIALAKENGFADLAERIGENQPLLAGEKFYYEHQHKSVILFAMGTEPMNRGMNITAAHIDSPRLDLKPVPLYEDGNLAMLKTHYYGGIKKYQWTAVPLAMHGVIYKKDGEQVVINVGEQEEDPVFFISDLLIHLSADQMAKTAAKAITGEQLNVIIGSIPVQDDDISKKVKFNILKILNDTYGITEDDFLTAELEIVPAGGPRDAGFDRSMISSYGHDDHVCAYAAMQSIFDLTAPVRTCACILADKEEIGSVGSTGLNGKFFENIVSEVYHLYTGNYSELELKRTMAHSYVLSMDVSSAFDPNFAEAYDKTNTATIGNGVVLEKYGGARGKSGSNDAHSEYLIKLRMLFENNSIIFQTGELGKVDQGGGGTVAYMLANYGAYTVDFGVAVLSMHAPYEIISKADLYETYRGAKLFYQIES